MLNSLPGIQGGSVRADRSGSESQLRLQGEPPGTQTHQCSETLSARKYKGLKVGIGEVKLSIISTYSIAQHVLT